MPNTPMVFDSFGPQRLGLETPAWFGLTVRNSTFVNFDRNGTIAVAGFAKALPPGAGYSFRKVPEW